MASDKQIKWVSVNSTKAGYPVDMKAVAKMENGELDQLFTDIKGAIADRTQQEKAHNLATKIVNADNDKFNVMRFGMCCKMVYNEDEAVESFKTGVRNLYTAITELEAEMRKEVA